jgi:hypothetical protein
MEQTRLEKVSDPICCVCVVFDDQLCSSNRFMALQMPVALAYGEIDDICPPFQVSNVMSLHLLC